MNLTKIVIENFRSIKSQTIVFDHNCMVLLGKNEAWKSNVLKAMAAVFGEYKVSDKDKRKRIDNETIDQCYVRAIIKLSDKDFDEILKRFQEKFTNIECIIFNSSKTLYDYIKRVFHEILIRIDIAENEKNYLSHWIYNDNNSEYQMQNELYVNGKNINVDKLGSKTKLATLFFEIAKELYNERPYICHYWKYDEKYLLSNSVSISDFIAITDNYQSLKNIFILCNRENIEKEFNDAKSQDGDYENLLTQISGETTKIFQKIWKDFKGTIIELRPNGTEITIKVVNKAKYAFEDRSDGFKKFISILLMLSTRVRSKQMGERDIILIDEPDQSLYPTSARYLRDELLKISETSKIIYSTHSQYMIDSDCIDRQLIIEKADDITVIKKPNENSPFSDDELLRRSIGSSIFECIQEKNIIFEGWLDKELFGKYCNFSQKVKEFKNIGTVHLAGIPGVETLVQLLILANKKFIIVADSDTVSNAKRKEFENDYAEYSQCWLAYADIVNDISTMEDFIIPDLIARCIKKYYSDFIYNDSRNAIENIDSVVEDKNTRRKIKTDIVKNLKKADVVNTYNLFIVQLKERLDRL
jgi:hypothetical protein